MIARHDLPLSLRTTLLLAALLLVLTPLAGCGGGSDSLDSATDSGELVIGLTDAQGDFLQYEVDVVSISLTKANGAVVETLPLQTRVDFAELTEMTEFVTAQRIPSGAYTAATMTLDYNGAALLLEDETGNGVTPAELLGPDGTPLTTTLEMRVDLDRDRPLMIAPGIPAHLTLDFDLAATHDVSWGPTDATVTVEPLLVADVELAAPKPHRVRGPLLATDPDDQSFTLGIRPLRARQRLGNRHLGRLQVATGDETAFEVDGQAATGEAGFRLLAGKGELTAVTVVGDLARGPRWRFRAREVYAGSSVPGGELDGVTGTVLARSGDTLTVKGAVLDRDGGVTLCTTLTLDIADATAFTKAGDPEADLDTSAASVGQRIAALGTYDPDNDSLDATEGFLRLLTTTLTGTVNAATEGELEISLQRLGTVRVDGETFDFTGTGLDAGSDADPAAYTVGTGTLNLTGLAADDPVRAYGFVAPFGAAPPDFDAATVVALEAVRARMQVRWRNGAGGVAVGENGLTVDPSGAGPLHHVVRAGVATELAGEQTVAPEGDTGLYVLRHRTCRVYLNWNRFADALQAALGDGAEVLHLGADGNYDDASQTLATRSVRVSLR